MSLTTGTRSLMLEVGSWICAACLLAVGLANYDELRAFAANTLGSQLPPPQFARSEPAQHAEPQANYNPNAVVLRAGRGGHFFTEAEIDGRPINVMVDTGATNVALNYRDAERAGIYLKHSDFTHRTRTANGIARVAPVMLHSVQIGSIKVRNVQASVAEPGINHPTLLGMAFLNKLDRVEIRSGKLILED